MFMPFAFVLILLTVPLAGGRLGLLSEVRVRHSGLIVLALGPQVLMTSVIAGAPHPLLIGLHMTSYVLVAWALWALWANRSIPGLPLIALGGGTNATVIALNGGTLPASADALARAGLPIDPAVYKNSGVLEDPVLAWLGDIAATPGWLPFRNVISIGDIVVLIGAAVMLHAVCRSRLHAAVASRRAPAATVAA